VLAKNPATPKDSGHPPSTTPNFFIRKEDSHPSPNYRHRSCLSESNPELRVEIKAPGRVAVKKGRDLPQVRGVLIQSPSRLAAGVTGFFARKEGAKREVL